MNPVDATTLPPPSPAASGAASISPPWADVYLRALSEHRQKALAALAAGQELPAIVRQRHTDPCFAQREAEILETLADLLESEAIRRTTARAPIKKVGSDALLLRLLKIFHPRWSLQEKQTLARIAPDHCTPNRPIRARREFDFGTRRQRADFQQWEREQAIALALSSFYEGFQNLPATSYSLSAQYRNLTGESLGHLPPRARAPWLRPTTNANTTTSPEPGPAPVATPLAAAGFEETEPERSGDGRRQKDCPATARQPEGCERRRASTPQTAEPASHPISSPAFTSASVPSVPSVVLKSSASSQESIAPAFPKPSAHSTVPAAPRKPGLGRRLLWGLAMPPEFNAGLKPYPGYIPWLIKVGAIRPPGTHQPTGASFNRTSRTSNTS